MPRPRIKTRKQRSDQMMPAHEPTGYQPSLGKKIMGFINELDEKLGIPELKPHQKVMRGRIKRVVRGE